MSAQVKCSTGLVDLHECQWHSDRIAAAHQACGLQSPCVMLVHQA